MFGGSLVGREWLAELKELLNLEYICLRPLGCSKAQGKEKLRGVAGISGKIWSQQRWRRHRFWEACAGSIGNVFRKWNDASKLII